MQSKLCLLNKLPSKQGCDAHEWDEKLFLLETSSGADSGSTVLWVKSWSKSWQSALQEASEPAPARSPDPSGLRWGRGGSLWDNKAETEEKTKFMNGKWCNRDPKLGQWLHVWGEVKWKREEAGLRLNGDNVALALSHCWTSVNVRL